MSRNNISIYFTAVSVLVLLTTIALADINDQVAQLDFDTATLDDVIRIFGEPTKYSWGGQTLEKDDLPIEVYTLFYPDDFQIIMFWDSVGELRFGSAGLGFFLWGQIGIGATVDEVISVVGEPLETVVGQPDGRQDKILYKDIDGDIGRCVYRRYDMNLVFNFRNYDLGWLFVLDNVDQPTGNIRTSVEEYDDVRWENISRFDLSESPNLPATLWFNLDTIWPAPDKMPSGCDPNIIMTNAMNPGLDVRALHQQGITGAGVNVAIIDQPMYTDHPEFDGKIIEYYDTGCNSESSMHGPSVTSLLVGENCGTAPGAQVYYCAASGLVYEVDFVEALDWIIQQNESLPGLEKIRIVSVSAAPGNAGYPSEPDEPKWSDACERAEAAGILVIDCTDERGLTNRGWYDPNDPENVEKFTAAVPGYPPSGSSEGIYCPVSRTMAEEYYEGDFSYHYTCRGGLSWTVPYCAGVLAMGWQIRPELTSEQMVDLLFQTAYVNPNGAMIIDPQAFINLVAQTPDSANQN